MRIPYHARALPTRPLSTDEWLGMACEAERLGYHPEAHTYLHWALIMDAR